MKKIIIGLAVIFVAVGVYFYAQKSKNNLVSLGCDQSTTTTPCAVIEKLRSQNPLVPETTSSDFVWRTYTNTDVGISFDYPTKNTGEEKWVVRKGDTGQSFCTNDIVLPSGASIFGCSFTKDYTAPKEGPGVSTEGYVMKDGKYYFINKGNPGSVPVVPDEILKTKDGSDILIVYRKDYDKNAEYVPAEIEAVINLNGKVFTGIGFGVYGASIVTPEDIAAFKKVVTSVRVLK